MRVNFRLTIDELKLYINPVQLIGEKNTMPGETTYTKARATFAALCDEVSSGRDVVIIRRRGAEDVALISASELRSIRETAHLLRSPRNAERLLKALMRARHGRGKSRTISQLRKELKIDTTE